MGKPHTVKRKPAVMVFAGIMLLVGLGLAAVGVLYFAALGWLFGLLVIASGLGSVGMASMAIITGNAEWVLLDLILPA